MTSELRSYIHAQLDALARLRLEQPHVGFCVRCGATFDTQSTALTAGGKERSTCRQAACRHPGRARFVAVSAEQRLARKREVQRAYRQTEKGREIRRAQRRAYRQRRRMAAAA